MEPSETRSSLVTTAQRVLILAVPSDPFVIDFQLSQRAYSL